MGNRAPRVVKLFDAVFEDAPRYRQDLLAGAFDPDRDRLSVVSMPAEVRTQGGRVLSLGVDYVLQGSTLSLTAAGFDKFDSLALGQLDVMVFQFGVSDGRAVTGNSLTLVVGGLNDAPESRDRTVTIAGTGRYVFSIADFAFIDIDRGDYLSAVEIETLPSQGRVLLRNREVRSGERIKIASINAGDLVYVPPGQGLGGSVSFKFEVMDRWGGESSRKTLTLTPVGSVNAAPQLTDVSRPDAVAELAQASAQDLGPITGTLTVSDSNVGDTLTANVVGAPSVALNGGALPAEFSASISALTLASALRFSGSVTANGAGQSIGWSYDPGIADLDFLAAGDTLTITFAVKVSDGRLDSGLKSVIITVTGSEDGAVIGTPAASTVIEDAAATLTASGFIPIVDPDRGQAGFRTAPLAVGTALGTLSLQANGFYAYSVANAAVQFLGAGQTHSDTFTVTALDGTTKQISFTITGTNDAADITGDTSKSIFETNARLTTSGRLAVSDADAGEATFQPLVDALGSGGSGRFQLASDGTWSYETDDALDRLADGQTYTDTVTARTADGTSRLISVTVTGTNDAGLFSGDTAGAITEADQALTITGRLHVADVDNPADTFRPRSNIVGDNGYGAFQVTADGVWTYVMTRAHDEFAAGQDYTDSFVVESLDRTAQRVTVTITGTNDAAFISGDTSIEIGEADLTSQGGRLFAADIDSLPNRFQTQSDAVGTGGYGKFQVGSDGAWSYALDATHHELAQDEVLIDRLTVASADGTAQTIEVRINGLNDAPVLSRQTEAQFANAGTPFLLQLAADTFTDIDAGDVLSLTASLADGSALPSWLTFDAQTRSFSGTPLQGDAATLAIRVTATDSHELGTSEIISLEVTASGEPPATPTLTLATSDQSISGHTEAGRIGFTGSTSPGETVQLMRGDGSVVIASTVSDTNGAFRFSGVEVTLGDNAFLVRAIDPVSHLASTGAAVHVVRDAPSTSADNAAIQWNAIALRAIANSGVAPTFASRALAMESLAVYNALAAIDGTQGYLFNAAAHPNASPAAAVAQAAHDVLVHLFPSQAAMLDALLSQSLAALPANVDQYGGISLGAGVAATVIALRENDGWNTEITDMGGTAEGQWRPTGPMFAPALDPQWATLTPFTMTSPGQYLPPAPPAADGVDTITTDAYANDLERTRALGGATGSARTEEQTLIARFWADGQGTVTPAGHWNSIATDASKAESLSLSATARLLLQLNLAQADAGIAAWNTKFAYDVWRPDTAIEIVDGDAAWQPLLVTPPFPEYVSGHSTYSGAAATILTATFGVDFAFSTKTTSLTGDVTRSFASFWDAANEAGESRIYGGIHYEFSNQTGLALGANVAGGVLALFNGTSDAVAPRILLTTPEGRVTNASPTIEGFVTDNLSGVARLQASIDGGAYADIAFNRNDGSFYLLTNLAADGSADGQHRVSFLARDAAGNTSALEPLTFVLASAPPAIILADDGINPNNGILGDTSHLKGTVRLATGNALTSLAYSFDGGIWHAIAFGADGSFDAALDVSRIAVGAAHSLVLKATDGAGNVSTATLATTLPSLPLTITSISPQNAEGDIGVTFRPRIEFSRPVDPATLTSSSIYATDSAGNVLAAVIVPFADNTGAWLLFNGPMPGGQAITLNVDGDLIRTADGTFLDADRNGIAGGRFTETFTTVSTAAVPGTVIRGFVLDPGPDLLPMTLDDVGGGPDQSLGTFSDNVWKLPLAHVKVFILGREGEAVFTDANGYFELTNVPAGDVKVAVDGRTATGIAPGLFFPEMVMDVQVQPGVVNTIMGGMGAGDTRAANATNPAVYLPRIDTAIMTPIAAVGSTVVHLTSGAGTTLTNTQIDDLTLTVAGGSVVDGSGNVVAGAKVGIATVPASMVMDMLPPGILQHSFDITIQVLDANDQPITGGAVFTQPATLTMPNVFGLKPGEKTFIMSFDHTTGRLVVDGTATVSADGLTVTTDPGSGVIQPGWHAMTPRLSHAKAIANLKKGDASGIGLSDINNVNSNIQTVGDAVTRFGSEAVKNSKVGMATRAFELVPFAGAGAAALAAEGDRRDLADHTQAFANNGDPTDGALALIDGVKLSLDSTSAAIGGAELVTAVGGPLGLPEIAVEEAGREVISGVGFGISVTEKAGQGLGGLAAWFDNWGNRNIVPNGPPIDPELTVALSVDGAPRHVRLYLNGVVQGDFTISAQRAEQQADTITIPGIIGQGPHEVTIEVLDAVAGNTLATQSNVYISGATFDGTAYAYSARLFGTGSDQSVDFHVGTGVTAVQTEFESKLQIAIAENEYLNRLYRIIESNLTAIYAVVEQADFTRPDLGLSAAQLSAVMPNLTAYADAVEQLKGHGSAVDAARDAMLVAARYTNELKAPHFEPITLGGSTLNPNSGTVAVGSVFYAALDDFNGNVQRFTFDPLVGIDYFLAPETTYKLTVFDPTGFRTGEVIFKSNGAGSDTAIPTFGVAPDHGLVLADGLTATAAFVVGVDPAKPDNLIPGMRDIEALRTGVVDAPLTVNSTGIIASLPILGEAKAIEIAAGGTNAATLTAYLATGSLGLAIVDVTNPRSPSLLRQIDLAGNATDVGIDRSLRLAAVALGDAGVAVVDVSNPLAPRLLRTLDVAATRIEVIDGVVYTGGGRHMFGYDLATGALVRQANVAQASSVLALAHDGTRLYAITGAANSAQRVLRAFETGGGALSELGSLTLGPADYSDGDRIFIADGIAYVGAATGTVGGGYATVDVSNPTAMTFLGHPAPFGVGQLLPVAGAALALDGSGRALAVQQVNDSVNGNFLVRNVADVLTVSNPAVTDNQVSRTALPATPFDVAVATGLGFVADGLGGLQILNYGGIDLAGISPTVSITSGLVDADGIAPGLQLVEGSRLNLDLSASDDRRVARVELLINGNPIDADVSYPFDLSAVLPTIAQNGGSTALTVQVRATDTGGNVGVSAPVAVTLVPDTAPFALVSTSPADQSAASPRQRTVSLTFSRPLDYRSVTTDNFRVIAPGGAVLSPASIALLADGKTVQLDFGSFAIGSGYEIDVAAANVRDLSGNVLGAADLVHHFDIRSDALWVSPLSGAWSNGANWNIGTPPAASDTVLMDLAAGVQATLSGVPTTVTVGSLDVRGLGSFVLQSYNVGFGPAQTQFNSTGDVWNSGTIDVQVADLEIGGDLHNSGTVLINANGNAGDSVRFSSDTARIDGGGTIVLSNGLPPFGQSGQLATGNNRLAGKTYSFGTVETVLENVDNLITGSGHIGAGFSDIEGFADIFKGDIFINGVDGVIRATGSQYLEINSAKLVNRGLIEATAGDPQYGAFIDIGTHGVIASVGTFGQFFRLGLELDNTAGRIVSNGSGTGINLIGTIVRGGTFETRDGGNIFFEKWGLSAATEAQGVSNSPMIDGTANAVRIVGADDTQLGLAFTLDETQLQGTLYNHANFYIVGFNSTVKPKFDRTGSLALTGDATLVGGGNINLQRPGDAEANGLDVGITSLQNEFDPDNPPPPHVLTNVDNTIQGWGTIGYAPNLHTSFGLPAERMGLVNEAQGRVIANGSTDRLTIRQVDIVNRGEIRAENSALLEIIDSTIDNATWTGNVIASGNGSRIEISGTALTTGYVRTENDGASIRVTNSFGNGTAFLIDGTNATSEFDGTNVIGGGLWHVKDGNVGRLTAGSTLEFSGTVVAERSSVTFENDVRVLLSDDAGFSGGGNLGDSFILLGGALTQVGTTSEAQQRGSNVVLTIDSVTLAGSGRLGDEFTDLATLGGGQIHVRTGDELTIGAWSFNNNGEVIVDGTLHFTSSATNFAYVTVSGGAVTFDGSQTFANMGGDFVVLGGSVDSVADVFNFARIAIDNGGSFTIGGSLAENVGLIEIVDGSLDVAGDVLHTSSGPVGTIRFGGGSVSVGGAWQSIVGSFEGGAGTLALAQSAAFGGTLYNFAAGDTIDLRDIASATGVISFSGTDEGGTLTIDDGGDVATLSVTFNGADTGWSADWANHFFLADNGIGGAYLTTDLTVIESGGGGGGGGGGNGIIDNAAELIVDADNPIVIDQDTVVRGGGSLRFEEGSIRSSAAVQIGGTPVTFTNEDNHLIAVTGRSGVIGDAFVNLVNNSVIEANGSLLVDAASTWNTYLVVASGGTVSVTNDIDNAFSQGGTLIQDGGTLRIGTWLHGNGLNQIGGSSTSTGDTLEVGTWQDGSIKFVGQTGRLILNETQFISTSSAQIEDFDSAQSIALRDIDFSTATLAYSGDDHSGVLTIADDAAHGSDVANLNLLFNFAASWSGGDGAAHFALQSDGQGGTLVTNDIVRPASI